MDAFRWVIFEMFPASNVNVLINRLRNQQAEMQIAYQEKKIVWTKVKHIFSFNSGPNTILFVNLFTAMTLTVNVQLTEDEIAQGLSGILPPHCLRHGCTEDGLYEVYTFSMF